MSAAAQADAYAKPEPASAPVHRRPRGDDADPALVAVTSVTRMVTVSPAPRREPPFDDELPAEVRDRTLHLVAGYERPLPFAPTPYPRAHTASVRTPTLTPDIRRRPDPRLIGRRILIALLEARGGHRPLTQLASYMSPSVQAGLAGFLSRIEWGPAQPTTLVSMRICEPAEGVAELSAVLRNGSRYRAVAARLEARDDRWRCVRLLLG